MSREAVVHAHLPGSLAINRYILPVPRGTVMLLGRGRSGSVDAERLRLPRWSSWHSGEPGVEYC